MNLIRRAIRNEAARALSSPLLAALALAPASVGHAAPTSGTVVEGNASIVATPNSTTIHQTSQSAVLNWQSFDIDVGESVSFLQPDSHSVALNRVLGADPSRIFGQLSANGTVFLVNPNGVLFGADARVDVGALVASTRDIADSDFLAGRYRFSGDGGGGVVNGGSIEADSGYVALLGASVSNEGVISARLGTVALGAGNALTLDVAGDGLLNIEVDAGAVDALVRNSGALRADGGQVLLTARSAGDLLQTAMNNTGLIQAQTLENRGGVIKLLGDMQSGTVSVDGMLDASAPNGGDGGFVETSAAHVHIEPTAVITTKAAQGASGLWLIDPFDFTIAASGGDMTGATLSASLASGNVTIQSTSGTTGVAGDINVNDTVSWSANQLTLHALNDININTAMNGSGTAQLAFEYGQGAVAAGSTSTVNVRAPVNLPAGNNFSTRHGSDGAVLNYTVITSLGAAGSTTGTDLQGIEGALTGNYALGSDIDASATSGWNGGAGFLPIGTSSNFSGTFDGLGHVVNNLYVNRPSTNNVGLFGYALNSTFRNVGVINGSISGQTYVGLLVANNQVGVYSNIYSTGVVSGISYVGGLIGLYNGGVGNDLYSTANVTGTSTLVGGLIGQARFYGSITNAYATGTVNGAGASLVGGLAGQVRFVTLTNGYATGAVTGSSQVGGLVGFLDSGSSTISDSYSTGAVSGSSFVGGLVGLRSGTVNGSFWNTTTSGRANAVGGGVSTGATGLTTAQMQAASSFTGWDFDNEWIVYAGHTYPLLRSFMTELTVTPTDVVKTYDGLAYSGSSGSTYSTVPNGNLLGSLSYGGTAQGAVNAGSYTLTASGLYSNQQGYIINYADGTLTIDPAVLTVAVSASDKVYDGNVLADVALTLDGLIGNETLGVSGTAEFNSKDVASANLVTVSSIALADGGNGGLASNYTVTGAATAAAHITPRTLTATVETSDKIYDGNVLADVALTLGGLVGNETLGVSGTAQFNSKDVADANVVTVDSITLTDGDNGGLASNYTLASGQTAAASISRRELTIIGQSVADKVYDGTTTATLAGGALDGLIVGDVVLLNESGFFASADVGTDIAVTATNSLSGAAAGNYSVVQPAGLSADIIAPALEIPEAPETPEPPPTELTLGYRQAVGHSVSSGAAMPVASDASSSVTAPTTASSTGAGALTPRLDLNGLNLTVEAEGLRLPSDVAPPEVVNDDE